MIQEWISEETLPCRIKFEHAREIVKWELTCNVEISIERYPSRTKNKLINKQEKATNRSRVILGLEMATSLSGSLD